MSSTTRTPPSNEAPSYVPPVRGVELPPVDLASYPPARIVSFTMKPHGIRERDVSTDLCYLYALQEVDGNFVQQLGKDPELCKVFKEMRMDGYSLLEIEGDDHLYSLVLMLQNALKTRLRFAVSQHLGVIAKCEYIDGGIEAKNQVLMKSSQEVLVVLSILENWATDEFDQQCAEAWDVLGMEPVMTTLEDNAAPGEENAHPTLPQ